MKMLSSKIIFSGFVLNIIVIVTLAWVSSKRNQIKDELLVLEIQKENISLHLQKTLNAINRFQSEAKGYAITGDEKFVTEASQFIFESEKNIQDLSDLLEENVTELKKVNTLGDLVEKQIDYHNKLIEHIKYKNFQEAKAMFPVGENIRLTRSIDSMISSITNDEEIYFMQKSEERESFGKVLKSVFVFFFIFSIVLLVFVFFIMQRNLRIKDQGEILLKENEQLLQAIIDNSGNPIFVKAINGQYILANRQFEALFNHKANHIKGKTDHQIFSKEIADRIRASDLEVLKIEKQIKIEEVLPHNGNFHTYLTIKFPIRDQAGRIYAIGGISVDITERAETDILLKENEEEIQKIFDMAPDAVIVTDSESKIIKWNKKAEELFKWSDVEVSGKTMPDIIMPQRYRESHLKAIDHFLQTGEAPILNKTIEITALKKNKTEFDIELTISASKIKDRYLFIAFIREITERKRLEKENQQTKIFLDSVIENIPNMLYVKDAKELRYVRMNKAGEKLLGYSRKDLLGKNVYDLFPKDKADYFTQQDARVLKEDDVIDIPEEEIDTHNGARLLHTKRIKIVDDKGEPVFILGISDDITEKKRLENERVKAEIKLHENEERIRMIVENIGDAVIATDQHAMISFMNPMAEELTGWKIEEAKGRSVDSVFNIVNDDTREKVQNPVVTAISEKRIVPLARNTVLYKKDKTEIHIDDSGSPIINKEGNIIGGVLIFRDVTDQVNAEKQIIASNKRFMQIFNLSPVALAISGFEDGKFAYVNETFCELFGYKREELIGKRSVDLNFFSAEVRQKLKEQVEAAGGHGKGLEVKFNRKNGEIIDALFSTERIEVDGKESLVTGLVNITEQKNTERQLSETSLLLQTSFDLTVEGVLAVNKEGKITTFNKRFSEMWRIPNEILATKDDDKAIGFVLSQLKDPDKFLAKVKELYSKPDAESFDVLDFKDGRIFERYSMPQRKNGEVFGRVWNFIDVTENKKAEKEIADSNQRFTQIFNLSPVAIAIASFEEGQFVYANEAFCKISGFKLEELIGKTSVELSIVSAEDREKITKQIQETNGSVKDIESKFKRRNGEIIDVLFSTERIVIDERMCLLTVFVDITEQKNVENKIAASDRRFTQIFNFTPVAVSISSADDGQFMYVNDTFCETLGFKREELIGKRSVDLNILGADQRKEIKEKTIAAGGRAKDIETTINKKDGEILNVLYSVEKLDIDNKMCAATAFVNITERKNAEQRIAMVLENIGEGVIVSDPEQHVLLSNHLANEILEIEDDHYSSDWTNRYEIYYPDGTVFPAQNLPVEKALRGKKMHDTEIVLADPKTKRKKLLRVSGQPIFAEDNHVIAAVVTLKDITQLREMELALKESESKYRKLIGFRRDGPKS